MDGEILMSWKDILKEDMVDTLEEWYPNKNATEKFNSLDASSKEIVEEWLHWAKENPKQHWAKRSYEPIHIILFGHASDYDGSLPDRASIKDKIDDFLETVDVKNFPKFKEIKSTLDDVEDMISEDLYMEIHEEAPNELKQTATNKMLSTAIEQHIEHVMKDLWGITLPIRDWD